MTVTSADLREQGVEMVRLLYSDIHGIYRGKDFVVDVFDQVAENGMNFAAANLVDGLNGDPLSGEGSFAELGFPDMTVLPVEESIRQLPWRPTTAWCLGQVKDGSLGAEYSSRSLLERVMQRCAELGYRPIVAPELEFYLFREDELGRIQRYIDRYAMVYSVGERADPEYVVRYMLKTAYDLGLEVTASNHEFGRGQYEINMNHGEALATADRTFMFKAMVKEVAATKGLLATFMGKPLNDDEGTALHLHISMLDEAGNNVFDDPDADDGISSVGRSFCAGILDHAPALTAILAPTVNAYRRLATGALSPRFANWGYDNRLAFCRVPDERGLATRFELRLADGATNPYVLVAAAILAGLHGIEQGLEPPPPIRTVHDITPSSGKSIPRSFESSLAALKADDELRERMGKIADTFALVKEAEVARFNAYVTDWELHEYLWHL